MIPSNLTADQRAAVQHAAKRLWRITRTAQDREDALQDAAEGVLRADGIDSARSASDRISYLAMRAFGAAIDARRRFDGRYRDEADRPVHVDDYEAAFETIAAPDDPLLICAVREALRCVQTLLPSPRPLVAARLAEGYGLDEIAAEIGVSTGRVCQLRREITTYLRDHFTCDICPV